MQICKAPAPFFKILSRWTFLRLWIDVFTAVVRSSTMSELEDLWYGT